MDQPNLDIVQDIKAVAQKLGRKQGDKLAQSEYLQNGQFSAYWIYDGGQTWENYCRAAGFVTRKKDPVSDEVYFSRLVDAVKTLGRLPKATERKKYGLNFTKRRFPTLKDFIDHAVSLGIVLGPAKEAEKPSESHNQQIEKHAVVHEGAADTRAIPVAPIPTHTKRKHWERTEIKGFPYAPQDELGVVALFGILCAERKIDWQIVEMRVVRGSTQLAMTTRPGNTSRSN
ncbi:MAG TPA: hypothetical protein VIG89_01910 [Candidatus Acidoferrales bacterium]